MKYAEKAIWVRELHHDWRVACSCGRMGWVVADKSDPPDVVRFFLQRFQNDHELVETFNHSCNASTMKDNHYVGHLRP